MKNKILIVNQNSGYLTVDVVNAFAEIYDDVVLMFGLNRIAKRQIHPKVKFQKTKVYNRSSNLNRLISWLLCTLHLSFLLLFKYRDYKILYYSNPPTSYFNSLVFKNPFSIVIFDTYPDALKLIGIKESSLIFKIWKIINQKVFTKSNNIITLSTGMQNQLAKYVDKSKIKVVPIWSASEEFKPIPKSNNPFLKAHDWSDKFIILYSGNMGIGHKLEPLIEIAKDLQYIENILFLFIGEGSKKITLEKLSKNYNLSNVKFLPWQDSKVLPYSLASANIAVAALEQEASKASVPSKTFNYMAVGLPILGICNPDSELAKLIDKHCIGVCEKGENTDNLKKFILDIYENKEKELELSSRSKEASKNYNYHLLAKEYLF